MYKWKPHDINTPFLTRPGEQIVDLDRYVEILKKIIFLSLKNNTKKPKKNSIKNKIEFFFIIKSF